MNSKTLHNSVFFFFVFSSLFITIRILLIGSAASESIGEYALSMLPDLFVFLITIYFAFLSYKNRSNIRLNYFDWIVIGYIVSNIAIGVILAGNIMLSLYAVRMSYLPMVFYFAARFNSENCESISLLIDKIFKWFVVIAVIGIVLYFGFHDTMIMMIHKTNPVVNEYFIVRMTSVFWTPVVFGTFMTTCFLYFFYKSTRQTSILNYIFQAIIITCVLLSVTRGAMLVLLIGLLFLSILSGKWKTFFITFCITCLVFIFGSFYIADPSTFLNWILHSTTETVGMERGVTRVELWIKAFHDFGIHPLGQGLGKAGHVAARFFDKSSTEASVSSTDGWFLKLANETGLWGLLSYFLLSFSVFIASVKYIRKYGFDFYSFLFTIFVITNIQNLVSNVLDFYLYSFLYWLLIGTMVFCYTLKVITNGKT